LKPALSATKAPALSVLCKGWLQGDHLGSTAIAANADGTLASEQRYKPWGEKRYPTGGSTLPTTFRFTGQRQEASLGGAEGLYYYGARWYDPYLNRWTQPDTIVPEASQGTQAWDRYAYVNNNPVHWT
jgi:RHS repeat-associated protein